MPGNFGRGRGASIVRSAPGTAGPAVPDADLTIDAPLLRPALPGEGLQDDQAIILEGYVTGVNSMERGAKRVEERVKVLGTLEQFRKVEGKESLFLRLNHDPSLGHIEAVKDIFKLPWSPKLKDVTPPAPPKGSSAQFFKILCNLTTEG